jgi:hypothetical protein
MVSGVGGPTPHNGFAVIAQNDRDLSLSHETNIDCVFLWLLSRFLLILSLRSKTSILSPKLMVDGWFASAHGAGGRRVSYRSPAIKEREEGLGRVDKMWTSGELPKR